MKIGKKDRPIQCYSEGEMSITQKCPNGKYSKIVKLSCVSPILDTVRRYKYWVDLILC